jgi:hypothetical protein
MSAFPSKIVGSRTHPERHVPAGAAMKIGKVEEARQRALAIVVSRGCVYRHADKYTIIRVYSRDRWEVQLLLDVFGGSCTQRSKTAFVWTCGKLPSLLFIRTNIGDALLTDRFKRLRDDERLRLQADEQRAA